MPVFSALNVLEVLNVTKSLSQSRIFGFGCQLEMKIAPLHAHRPSRFSENTP